MLSPRLRTTLTYALLLAATLAGCSEAAEDAELATQRSPEVARQFSEEEQLAARALSISNASTVSDGGSPYDQAVLCSSAIEALADRLRDSDIITAEQLQVVEQAKVAYDDRMRMLASQMPATDGVSENSVIGAEESAPADNARQALGCLQALAEAS